MTSTFVDNGAGNGAARKLIPGAYERIPLTRQPGAMGGAAYGSDHIPLGPGTMSAATIAERQKEGGGGVSQRPSRPETSRSRSE
jgi:hypothetical protein